MEPKLIESKLIEPKPIEGHIQGKKYNIYYQCVGNGYPLVLLHGNGQSSRSFDRQIRFFKAYYKVIAIDSPGHGKSGYGKSPLNLEDMAEDIYHILKMLDIEKPLLIGFSDGGNLGIRIAMIDNDFIKGLVLIGANMHDQGLRLLFRLLIRVLLILLKMMSFLPWFNQKRQVISLMLGQSEGNMSRISAYHMPVLIVTGEKDIVELNHSKEMAANFPKAELHIIKKSGHFVLRNREKEVHSVILEFFNNIQ